MKLLIIICLTLIFAIAGHAQQNCTDLADCNAKLDTAAQVLNKTLDINEAQKLLIASQKDEILALNRLIEVKTLLDAEKNKLIDYYRKQTCSRFSFLFGLVSFRKCRL